MKLKISPEKFFKHVLFLLVFLAAIRLGVWQMDRASAMKEAAKPMVEKPIVALTNIGKPRVTISEVAINRLVEGLTTRVIWRHRRPIQRARAARGRWRR
jgi:glycerol-3-phosphate acyltransferase PlsY